MTEVHDPHRQRDLLTARAGGKPLAVPPLEGEAQGVANVRTEIQPSHQHVAHLATRGEVVHGPVVRSGLDRLNYLLAFLRGVVGGREREHVAHDFGRIRGVMHKRLGADGDLIAEHGSDLVRMPCTTDVPQQRHPIDGFAQLTIEAGFLTQRRGQQTRSQLRLEWLTKRVILRKGERRDELAEPK